MEKLKPSLAELAKAFEEAVEEEDWFTVELDNCTWVVLLLSEHSEIEIKLVTGAAEIEKDGTLVGQFEGVVRASGVIRVHGLRDGTKVKYRNL
jgi:hypothetical protein